jgi:hypothetical protein
VSLAVDFGRIRLARAQLQTTADVAARAGALSLPKSSQAVIDDAVYVAVENSVIDTDDASNGRTNPGVQLEPVEDVIFGLWDPQAHTFTELQDHPGSDQDERRGANAVRAHARRIDERNNPVKLIFAPVVGAFSTQIEREATVYITDGRSNFAFVGIDSVRSTGNQTMIDSAIYGMTGTGGGVASNGDIDLGNGDVYGDARAGGDLIQKGNSIVTGWTAPLDYDLSDRFPPDKYAPTIPLTGTTTGISPANVYNTVTHTLTITGVDVTVNSGTYRFKDWKHTGAGNITVNGPSTFYIDSDFMMAGSANKLIINSANGPVKFYVNGNFDQSGGNIVNTGSASNLYISLTGTGSTLTMNGTLTTAAHIYAPLSDVTVLGTPGFTGWIIGKTLELKGNCALHYDETGKNSDAYKLHLVK